jgi:hypothetical protein
MSQDQMYELLLQCWTVAYEKAIVQKIPSRAKKTIDEASCEAVEDLTKRLKEEAKRLKEEGKDPGYDIPDEDLEEATSRRFETIKASIDHHIENLKKGKMFNLDQNLNIDERTEHGAKVVEITVENCTYQEGCKWALDEPVFRENGQYRCQRLGCCVGAVKKYMKDNNLPEEQIKKVNYFMETVIETTEEDMNAGIKCKCIGLISIN